MTEYIRVQPVDPKTPLFPQDRYVRKKQGTLNLEQIAARMTTTTASLGSGVSLSRADRLQGLYILGVQGTGKSTLLEHLILQDIQQGLGVCLIEPHGDITRNVLSRIPKRREKDIIYLDLMQTELPFGLNLFDCPDPANITKVESTKSFVMHVFEKVLGAGIETQQLNRILRNVTYTLIANPGTTFLEIPLLLLHKKTREKLVANVTNPQVRLFWEDFYEKMSERERLSFISSLLNRVDAFAASPLLQTIIGQSTTSLDFRKIMDEGKILLIQLPPRFEDIANLIGAVVIGKLLDAAYSRQGTLEGERRQFHIYADEFQRFAIEDFATFFTEARKFKVGLTVAHQFREQLDAENRGATLTVANIVVFRVTPEDAAELAARCDITPAPAYEQEIEKESVEIVQEPWVQTLERERLEKIPVEVIDGVEPILALTDKPFEHLIRGHSNAQVSQYSGILRELANTLESAQAETDQADLWTKQLSSERVFRQRPDTYEESIEYVATREQLLHGKQLIETLLADIQHGKIEYGSFIMVDRLVEIAEALRAFIGFAHGAVWKEESEVIDLSYTTYSRGVKQNIPRSQSASRAGWVDIFLNPETASSLTALTRVVVSEVPADNQEEGASSVPAVDMSAVKKDFTQARVLSLVQTEVEQEVYSEQKEQFVQIPAPQSLEDMYKIRAEGIYKLPVELSVEEHGEVLRERVLKVAKFRPIAQAETRRLMDFLTQLAGLCLAFSSPEQHIHVPSGQYQERKRTQVHLIQHPRYTLTHPPITLTHPRKAILHPQRSYQDMLNEVASGLVRMPNFTAKVVMGAHEHKIATSPHKPGMERWELAKRLERVRENNLREKYLRSRSEVAVEIAERQDWLRSERKEPPPGRTTSDEEEK